ncbi:MAG: hypothetical protein RLY16_2399 [Bacteroidota bacterium]
MQFRFKLFIFFTFLLSNCFAQQDELSNLYKKINNRADSTTIDAYLDLANYYWETNPDSSIYYGKLSLSLATKLNNSTRIAQSLQTIGIGYDYKGNLDSCLWHLNESVAQYKKINKLEKQSHVISDIATAWYFRGNYELALRFHLKALQMRQQFGDKRFISISYNNLGLVYRSKKDYTKAINYYKLSLQLKQQLKDEKGMINSLMNTGSAFQSQGIYDSAYRYAGDALALAKKNNLINDIIAAEGNMAAALIKMNQQEEALQIALRVEQKAIELKEKKILITTYETLGEISFERKQFLLAIQYFGKGLDIATSNKRLEAEEVFCRKLARTYYEMGDYKKGFEYFETGKKLSDSLLNTENTRQMNELSAVYETTEKEKQITTLNAEKKVAVAESERKKQQNIYLIITALLFFGIALISYKAFTTNKKQKELLNQKNIAIEKALEEKEFLMREIHHRVKNNLQMVSSLLSLQSNFIKDETALEAVNDSRNRVHSMSLIHQSLYNDESLREINVKDYTDKLVENLYQSYTINPDKIKMVAEIAPIQLDIDTIIPVGLILNELITNCLKYAFPHQSNGMIKVKLYQENQMLKLSVYDNGAGLPEHFFTAQHTTFGHKMIQAFLKKWNGKMNIYSEDGTKVDIHIPLTQA